MIEIQGAYNSAIVYTENLEELARSQIQSVCDQEAFAGCKLRIMPDVHAGKGCTIGTTMTIRDKIVPGMVGVDIGCGMETIRIAEKSMDFDRLDQLIRTNIPFGRNTRKKPHPYAEQVPLDALKCSAHVNLSRARCSVGTLGGGNHFIEVDRGQDGCYYLVVHSGSRHLGLQTANWYQAEGFKALCGGSMPDINAVIAQLKAQGRHREIQPTIQALKANRRTMTGVPEALAYVEGALFADYLHDMKIVQHFATMNRQAMVDILVKGMGWTETERFTTIHNYIDTDHMLLRKGAVSAQKGEKLLIPINMRDGSLICVGKGNPDWNCSAPHGAGRLMSRTSAFGRLSMEAYRDAMKGIYTTCVSRDTLDEAPMAYKDMAEIISQIGPTAEILENIKPVYNFKAAE